MSSASVSLEQVVQTTIKQGATPVQSVGGFVSNFVTAFFDRTVAPSDTSAVPQLGYANVTPSAAQISTSLGQIEKATGVKKPSPFDIVIDGSFDLLSSGSASGSQKSLHLGLGYQLSPGTVIGSVVTIGALDLVDNAAETSQAGVMVTPFIGGRINETLSYALYAGFGLDTYSFSPAGTYVDHTSGQTVLAGGDLSGTYTSDIWTFAPVASLTYFARSLDAYTDSTGINVAAYQYSSLSLGLTPRLSARFTLDDGTAFIPELRAGLSLAAQNEDGEWSYSGLSDLAGLGLKFVLPGGATLSSSVTARGLMLGDSTSVSLRAGLRAPLP